MNIERFYAFMKFKINDNADVSTSLPSKAGGPRIAWWVVLHREAMISLPVKRLYKLIVLNIFDRKIKLSTVAFSMRFIIPSATEVCYAHRTFRHTTDKLSCATFLRRKACTYSNSIVL